MREEVAALPLLIRGPRRTDRAEKPDEDVNATKYKVDWTVVYLRKDVEDARANDCRLLQRNLYESAVHGKLQHVFRQARSGLAENEGLLRCNECKRHHEVHHALRTG